MTWDLEISKLAICLELEIECGTLTTKDWKVTIVLETAPLETTVFQ